MCARVLRLLLAGVFVYLTATVAAFVYLEWWQAILASAAAFLLMVFAVKLLIKSAIGNLGNMAKGLFDVKSRVLRGATVQTHSVRPAPPPADVVVVEDPPPDPLAAPAWYEIEATIFPDPAAVGPMAHWDVDDLRVVPADATPPNMDDDDEDEPDRAESELHELRVVVDGEPREPEGSKFTGPQRLRFVCGLPPGVREAKFQYYFEQFGRVPLSNPALPR